MRIVLAGMLAPPSASSSPSSLTKVITTNTTTTMAIRIADPTADFFSMASPRSIAWRRDQRNRSRPMTIRWIWLVPSKIWVILASRIIRSTGYSRV